MDIILKSESFGLLLYVFNRSSLTITNNIINQIDYCYIYLIEYISQIEKWQSPFLIHEIVTNIFSTQNKIFVF
jgi:hypothetical protein